MSYRAPVDDLFFILTNVAGLANVSATEKFADAQPETVRAILAEAARMCDDVLAPLQRAGDQHPATLTDGKVKTSPGFAEGYRAIADGGWIGASASPDFGGMGLPVAVSMAVQDMMSGACLALQLNPLMTQGQIEALEHHASDEIKALYLPKLTSGEWCGTMNLTEPQAGSDVGALTTKAVPNGDGTYAITGHKIFITWADNDFSENVCHLVLARLPDGPAGTKGISLFIVPKLIPDENGTPGAANSLHVQSLEHKLGLHGSPTATMRYEGATGWLIGEEHGGMAAMFTMMNNARLGVGLQGVGVAEAATQAATTFAAERIQGRTQEGEGSTGAIIDHADVRRMLATMRAETYAARAIALQCATAIDMSNATGDPDWGARAAILTPVSKAFGTDTGIDMASLGMQVHGGMGYIEETGAAQFLRDVRVTSIYEGTNGIQALDLVGRKMSDGGAAVFAALEHVCDGAKVANAVQPELAVAVWEAAESMREATEFLAAKPAAERAAVAAPFLRAFARVLGGCAHLTAIAKGDEARQNLGRFYITRLLPEHESLLRQVYAGEDAVLCVSAQDLLG